MESESEVERGNITKNKNSLKCRRYLRQWLGVFGAFLILFPEYLPSQWGNMKIYLSSYFYREHGSTSVESDWVLAAFFIGSNAGVNIAAYVMFMGTKKLLIITIVTFNVGILCIFVALKYGWTLLLFFIFLTAGLCGGFMEQLIYKALSEISDSSKGIYRSIAVSGFNFGPFFINILIGFFMNPDNLPPTLVVNGYPMFDQNSLTDKVPYTIIILGISSFLCMFTGYCLISFSLKTSTQIRGTINTNSSPVKEYGSLSKDTEEGVSVSDRASSSQNLDREAAKTESEQVNLGRDDATENNFLTTQDDLDDHPIASLSTTKIYNPINSLSRNDEREMSFIQILKYIPFYAMWFAYGIDIFPLILLNGSYKTYGLRFINDDLFLVKLGAAYSIAGGIARLAWGFFLDRFAIKNCLVFVYAFLSFSVLMMYFAPVVDKYLYFSIVLAVSFGVNQVMPSFQAVSSVYFGEKNFAKAMGLISTLRVPLAFVISPMMEQLQASFGWFGQFCISTVVVIISLVLIVVFIPYIPASKNKELKEGTQTETSE